MPPPPKVTCDLPVPDWPCVRTSASKPRMSQSTTSTARVSGASPESDAAVILYRRGVRGASSLAGSATATPSPPGSNATAGVGGLPSPREELCRLEVLVPTVAERTGAGQTLQYTAAGAMAASPPPPKERNSASKARSSSERAATLAIGADTEDRCIGAGVQVHFEQKTHIRKYGVRCRMGKMGFG